MTTQLLLVAAKLNVADELAGGPQSPEALARMAGNGRLKCLERKFASSHSSRVRRLGFVKATVAAFKTWQLTVSRHRAIADLSPDQLRDIGHAEAPAAVLEVKPGLITYLMSMR
ncbi:hypothetical protein [Rhizobium laguerreae]|uniref:hypothetical protein n=1 Tax=Rhizobium laguerreae TaxID=1076926 RepID=UPI001FE6C870|nr:hypothetical protein [Rhizobium laguerreae]